MEGFGAHTGLGMNAELHTAVYPAPGVGAGYGAYPGYHPTVQAGYGTSTGVILVLFILLVIISRSC